jgi:transposase-like protein
LLRREGLYSSHLVTWRRQREHGLTPKKRGRKPTSGDPRAKKLAREKATLEAENRRLERRLAASGDDHRVPKKKLPSSWGSPLKPLPSDEDD